MNKLHKYLITIVGIIIFAIIFIVSVNIYVLGFSKSGYYIDITELPEHGVGVVLGASVRNDAPSDILRDRLDVAFEAYNAGKIEKLLLSGDNAQFSYNEPVAMQSYLLDLGVDELDIYLDYAGFDTYDTLYRARDIFGVQDVIIFTQDFHLKRSLYIAKRLGMNAHGMETNLHVYKKQNYNNFREIFARVKAFLEIEIFKNKPKYLGDAIEIVSDEKIESVKKEILE